MVKSNYVTDERFNEGLEEIRTFILESEERIMGEIKHMREVHDTHQYSHARINDEIQEHDDRLKVLEGKN